MRWLHWLDRARLAGWSAALGLALLTSGCATPPAAPAKSVASVPASKHFQLSGRLSLRVDQRIEVVNIRWQRTAEREEILLLSPLGSTVARLEQNAGSTARLDEGKGPTREARSIAELISDVLGQTVPLDELSWWLQGWQAGGTQPLPPGDFRHGEWQVALEKNEEGRVSRLEATRGDVRLRMVVDSFEARS